MVVAVLAPPRGFANPVDDLVGLLDVNVVARVARAAITRTQVFPAGAVRPFLVGTSCRPAPRRMWGKRCPCILGSSPPSAL